MSEKPNAEMICAAITELEENTRKATLVEIRDELRAWAAGKWVGKGETQDDLEELIPGLTAAFEFLTENYGLDS